jgi:hypothetical protein
MEAKILSTSTTAYRDYVVPEFALPAFGQTCDAFGATPPADLRRSLRRPFAHATTSEREFVFEDDAKPGSVEAVPLVLREPTSELEVVVRSPPIKVRRVKVRIGARTKGTPNPILPQNGG